MTWRATILTLFPTMFPGPLGQSLAGRALENGIWSLDVALQLQACLTHDRGERSHRIRA